MAHPEDNELLLEGITEIRKYERDKSASQIAGLEAENANLVLQVSQISGELSVANDSLEAVQVKLEVAQAKACPDPTRHAGTPTQNPDPTAPPRFLIGIAYQGNADPTPVETRLGIKLDINHTYWRADQVGSAITRVKANIAAGRDCSELAFKFPVSWASVVAGGADAWFKDLVAKLKAIPEVASGKHLILLSTHHEPENDGEKGGPNDGATVAGRDAWKAAQARMAPLADGIPGIEFGVCLMGYHSFFGTVNSRTGQNMKVLWNPDACVPKIKAIKFVSFDLYEEWGPRIDGKPARTNWKDWEAYFKLIKAFVDRRAAEGFPLKWGLSETGLTEEAEDAKPGRMASIIALEKQYGGSWYDYFSSSLNSTAMWEIKAGDSREKALAAELKKVNA